MTKCIGLVLLRSLVLLPFAKCLLWPQAVLERPPIIDMHLHAHTISMYGAPPPAACTNDREIIFPAWDQRRPRPPAGGSKECHAPLRAASTDDELLRETLGLLKKYDIRAVTSGPLEQVTKWREAAPDRIIPAVPFDDYEKRDPDAYRRLFKDGKFAIFAEISSQYSGLTPADESLEPYFALAEEEGGSGKGKSVIVRILNPIGENVKFLERVDDFTPASFVSHAANRTEKQLREIDLLPRIKDKVMLTKELAPLFRDDEKDLRQNFARLTAILDGEGYKTHSGTHGRRGYEGRYVFNWIGATTPIPDRTYNVMAQLGNRIFNYEVAGEEATEEELIEFAAGYETNDAVLECRNVANDFIKAFFREHPVESVDPNQVEIPSKMLRLIVKYAKLICNARVEVHDDEAELPEGPHRVILLLQTLACGVALADGRFYVSDDDLVIVRHIAFSSMPAKRRDLLRAVLAAGGEMTSGQVAEALGVSAPTALKRMRELGATGVCEYVVGNSERSQPARIKLSENVAWLMAPPLKNFGVRGSREREEEKVH